MLSQIDGIGEREEYMRKKKNVSPYERGCDYFQGGGDGCGEKWGEGRYMKPATPC